MVTMVDYTMPSEYSPTVTPGGVIASLAADVLFIAALAAISSYSERAEERRNGYVSHDERFRREQVRRISQKEEELKRRRERNEELLNNVSEVLGMVRECVDTVNELPHGSLFVKENDETFKNLEQSLRFIRDTHAEGNTVSRAFARQAYEAAKEYEAEAIEYEKRWENAYAEWNRVWLQTHDLIENERRFTIRMNTDAGEETAEIDSDFWSRGAFDAAAKALPEKECSDETTIREFSELTGQTRALYTRIEGVIEQAEHEYVRHLVRCQMAEAVCDELYACGWFCADESCLGFKDDDKRESVILRIQNPAHDELELTFTADNQLFLEYRFSGVHNRDVIDRLMQTITDTLGDIGVSVDQLSQKA